MPASSNAQPNHSLDLSDRIRANDPSTLERLYSAHFGKVEHYVVQHSGSADEAKDIFQEAFLATWRNIQLGKFMPQDESSFGGYLFRVAQYKWVDELRSPKRKYSRPLPVLVLNENSVDDSSAGEMDYLASVKKHFSSLGDQCRELLKKFYFDKKSMREIADYFSWTEASAKNNKYRCIQRLRALVTGKQ